MLNISNAENVVKTALDEVFMQGFDMQVAPGTATAATPEVFNQDSTDRNAVIVEQYAGPGYFEQRAEQQAVPEGRVLVGNQQTHSVVNYSKGINISKNFKDDDQHSTYQRTLKQFGINASKSRDRIAFDQFNLGFTTVLSNDGLALFANAHTLQNSTGTVDNLELGVLTEANLETLMNSLRNQLTQDGTYAGHAPGALLVPLELHKEAQEITKSELRAGTGNNDLNYFSQIYPGLQVFTSGFLNATVGQNGSDTAYYLLSRNHSMTRWVRQGLETALVPWQIQDNNDYRYKAEYREVVAPISWEGMAASNGTV